MTEWARLAKTTIRDYIAGSEDNVTRYRPFMAMLKAKGRMVYNCSGDGFEWKTRYKRGEVTTNNGEQTLEFGRVNRHEAAYLDYEGYAIAERVTKREKLKNRGKAAIVKFFGSLAEDMKSDLTDRFAEEIFVDSSATGNSDRWTGLESMFSINGTINITSGAQRAANAADVCGYPNDTYATLTCGLGDYGGAWGTQTSIDNVWPYGRGDSAYDHWAPVVVNTTSTAFGSSPSFAAYADKIMGYALGALQGRLPSDGGPDLILLDRGMYRVLKELLRTKERINIEHTGLRKLGFDFEDSINFDGVSVTTDYGVPPGVGYVLNMSNVECRSMQDTLFVMDEESWDPQSRSWRFVVDCLGQWKFKSPRNFGKLVAIA